LSERAGRLRGGGHFLAAGLRPAQAVSGSQQTRCTHHATLPAIPHFHRCNKDLFFLAPLQRTLRHFECVTGGNIRGAEPCGVTSATYSSSNGGCVALLPYFPTPSNFIAVNFLTSKNKTPVLGNAVLGIGVKLRQGCSVFWLLFNIDLCSATSMESSHRDLFNDMAEHRPILKIDQNTITPF